MNWSEGLQGEVLEIAKSPSKRLRVMAGPGTGKTFAMKKRITRLLEEEHIPPEQILAVTFTRTSAADLKKEIQQGIPGAEKISAMTLHAFCFLVLNQQEVFAQIRRVPRPLKTFNSKGSPQFELSPLLSDLDLIDNFGDKKEKFQMIKAMESAWARRQSDTLWEKTEKDKLFHREMANWLSQHSCMLIGELIPLTLTYLQQNPMSNILREYKHIIVDEYQDLNRAEQELIDLLGKNSSISIVGDVDQSIYSFRNAHPEGINDFSNRHQSVEDKTLNECRRCDKVIVSIANSLIQNNHQPSGKNRLNSHPQKGEGTVHLIQWQTVEDEIKGISQLVKKLIDSDKYKANDILIMSPRRLFGYKLRDLLLKNNIPAHSFFHEEAIESKEAQRAITLYNLFINPNDAVSLRYWLGMGSQDWRANQYKILQNLAVKENKAIPELLDECIAETRTIKSITQTLKKYDQLLKAKIEMKELSVTHIIDYLFPEGDEATASLREASLLFTAKYPEATAEELWEYLDGVVTQPQESPENGDFVRIMSLHKSKGLTSKVAIISSCIEGLIPYLDKKLTPNDATESLKEQRRLFYVALTRAKELLVISSFIQISPKLAFQIGASIPRSPKRNTVNTIASQFMQELGINCPKAVPGDTILD